MIWFLFFLQSWVVYRVTRFVLEDSLFDELRAWFLRKVDGPPTGVYTFKVGDEAPKPPRPPSVWREKLHALFVCPYCFSVWVAAGATVIVDHYYDIPLPVFWWVATSGVAMAWWRYVEAN